MIARKKILITREKGIKKHEYWNQKEWGLYLDFLLSMKMTTGQFLAFSSSLHLVSSPEVTINTDPEGCL